MIRNKNADIIRAIKDKKCCKDVVLESLEVTENNTYTAEEGKAWNEVTVNVEGSGGITISQWLHYTFPTITSGDNFLLPDAIVAVTGEEEMTLTLISTVDDLYDFIAVTSSEYELMAVFSENIELPETFTWFCYNAISISQSVDGTGPIFSLSAHQATGASSEYLVKAMQVNETTVYCIEPKSLS